MANDRAYRVHVLFDAKADSYHAKVPELEIDVEADSRSGAIEQAEAAIESAIEAFATSDSAVPKPVDAEAPEPGEITLQLAGPLYRELQFAAQTSKMDPSELALQLLARALGQLDGRRPPRMRPKKNAPEEGAEAAPKEDGDQQPSAEDNKDKGKGRRGRNNNRGGGRGRGGRREGYRPEIENQADFLAYVRDMEKGGRGRR